MHNRLIFLEANSVENLEKEIARFSEREDIRGKLVLLNTFGSKVIVRQFEMPKLSEQELKKSLRLEATELLSLASPEEVSCEYQVFESQGEKISGFFAAISNRLLDEYFYCCNKAGLVLIEVRLSIFSLVNSFLSTQHVESKSFCILDCAKKDILHLAIFDSGICSFLREVHYDNLDDLSQEVSDSLKYNYSKKFSKQINEIYVCGEDPEKSKLFLDLGSNLKAKVNYIKPIAINLLASSNKEYFKVNLVKEQSVNLAAYQGLIRNINIFIFFLGFVLFFVSGLVFSSVLKLNNTLSIVKTQDYNYAKDLKRRITQLKNAK
jgi:Tfp pilus assembly PilM family ATPase